MRICLLCYVIVFVVLLLRPYSVTLATLSIGASIVSSIFVSLFLCFFSKCLCLKSTKIISFTLWFFMIFGSTIWYFSFNYPQIPSFTCAFVFVLIFYGADGRGSTKITTSTRMLNLTSTSADIK